MLAIRMLFSLLILVLPILAASAGAGGWAFLIGLIAGIPAVVVVFVVFLPLEVLCDIWKSNILKNILVPLSGPMVFAIFMIVMAGGNIKFLISRIDNGSGGEVFIMMGWGFAALIWGVIWRISEYVAVRFVSTLRI